jgi:energy-coupling factor transport system ATP-binding protein
VLADGTPRDVLARHGASLAATGVWVPGRTPASPQRTPVEPDRLMLASDLTVGRRGMPIQAHLDLEVSSGRSLAITGPNGAGKTTLGLTLAGLIPPVSGVLDATGLARGLSAAPLAWKSRELVTRIGSVFQDPEHQFVAGSVREELAVGPRASKIAPAEIARRVDEVAVRLRLADLMDVNPFMLSGGEKRRLSVATALVSAPPLLVLDEPTFGQDSRTWAELVQLLAELLNAGSSIVSITHDAAFVDAIADDELHMTRQLVSR